MSEAEDHRLNYYAAFPEGISTLVAWGKTVNQSGLEQSLHELVKMRASMINGCAFCIDMHARDAMAQGETSQRLFALGAWRETTFFTPRERAALAWTEAVTDIHEGHAERAIYDEVLQHFTEAEAVKLTMAITLINVWNRLAIAFRAPVALAKPKA